MAADIDSAIAAAELKLQSSTKSVDALAKRQQDDDRSHIAKLIVWSFIILMGIEVLGVIAGTAVFSDWTRLAEPAKFLAGILSSVMLPVVTLVIGYYFGSK